MSGLMKHSPADVLRRLLVNLSHGTLPSAAGSWPISVGSEMDTPDQCITIYDTAGRYDGREMHTGEKYEFHGIQIRVRGTNHTDTATRASVIAVALDQEIKQSKVAITNSDATISRYMVYAVSRTSGPLSLGREPGTNRVLFTINAVVTLRQTS